MRRWKAIGLVVLIALLVCLGLYLVPQPKEPSYKGKTLGQWLDRFDYDSNFVDGQGRRLPAWEEDVAALRAIGTNALPSLIHELKKRGSRLKTFLLRRARSWYGGIPVANRRTINFFKTDFDRKRDAAEVLSVLREQAAPAVPELISMLESSDDGAAQLAADTVGRIGPPAAAAVPALIEKLKQRKPFAFSAISGLGRAAEQAVPDLIPFLSDSNVNYRVNAASALIGIGPSAAEALPALLASLDDTNDLVRLNALSAIASLGVRNESVIQSVLVLTNDSTLDVRRHADWVLKQLRADP